MTRVRPFLAIVLLRDDEFWKRSVWHRLGRFLLFFTYCYLGVILVLLALENWFLFPAAKAETDWFSPPDALTVEDVSLTSADGNTLHGWWAAPVGWKPEQGAVLYCHGNAGNLSHRGQSLLLWRDKFGKGVLIFDYPGYGKSTGKPSEKGCYLAGDAAYEWLVSVKAVNPANVVLFGNSLGGAIAIDLAVRKECRALALRASFTCFPDMAQKTFPWLPARWLVRNRLDNVGKIGSVQVPIFHAHGTADTLIPFSQGERLFAAAKDPKRFLPLVGHGHNAGVTPEYLEGLKAYLAEVAPKP